jgi:hypothetical protein
MAQISLSLSGVFCPTSFPLFQGLRTSRTLNSFMAGSSKLKSLNLALSGQPVARSRCEAVGHARARRVPFVDGFARPLTECRRQEQRPGECAEHPGGRDVERRERNEFGGVFRCGRIPTPWRGSRVEPVAVGLGRGREQAKKAGLDKFRESGCEETRRGFLSARLKPPLHPGSIRSAWR